MTWSSGSSESRDDQQAPQSPRKAIVAVVRKTRESADLDRGRQPLPTVVVVDVASRVNMKVRGRQSNRRSQLLLLLLRQLRGGVWIQPHLLDRIAPQIRRAKGVVYFVAFGAGVEFVVCVSHENRVLLERVGRGHGL